MKSVVLTLALVACAAAYPKPADEVVPKSDSDETKEETEFVRVPLERSQPRGVGFDISIPDLFAQPPSFGQDPFFRQPSTWDFGPQEDDERDFVTQMQEMLREIRKQLKDLVHKEHGFGAGEGEVGTRIGDELPKNQTTSETKVIDGHVVTVNETVYSSGGDDVGAVFRIKIVEVVPSESPVDSDSETTEASESPQNVTPKTSELEEDKHEEETNEISKSEQKVRYVWSPEFDPSTNELDNIEQFTKTEDEFNYDLNRDTKVNEFLSDQAESQGLVMIDPDAELVDPSTNLYYHYNAQPQRLQLQER